MGDRYIKSDESKKNINIDDISLHGWAMSESLPYDEIEMWHGHPDLFLDNLDEILNTSDDSVFGKLI